MRLGLSSLTGSGRGCAYLAEREIGCPVGGDLLLGQPSSSELADRIGPLLWTGPAQSLPNVRRGNDR